MIKFINIFYEKYFIQNILSKKLIEISCKNKICKYFFKKNSKENQQKHMNFLIVIIIHVNYLRD